MIGRGFIQRATVVAFFFVLAALLQPLVVFAQPEAAAATAGGPVWHYLGAAIGLGMVVIGAALGIGKCGWRRREHRGSRPPQRRSPAR
jgi:hypothetical protein